MNIQGSIDDDYPALTTYPQEPTQHEVVRLSISLIAQLTSLAEPFLEPYASSESIG